MRSLVPFVQFKNVKKTHGELLLLTKLQDKAILGMVKLKPAILLKVALHHERFSRFLNCTTGIKLRNASHIILLDKAKNNLLILIFKNVDTKHNLSNSSMQNFLNLFMSLVSFYILRRQKTFGSLIFSGNIEGSVA